jgi:hypothetical protein
MRAAAAAPADTDAARAAGLGAGDVEEILGELFVRRTAPSDTGRPDSALTAALGQALAHEHLPVSQAETAEIVRLLETGQFYGDIVGSAGAVFHTIPALPQALLRDFPDVATLPLRAPRSIFGDVFALFGAVPRVIADLRDGRIDEPPATMTRFLAVLYGLATVDRLRDLMQRLLDPRNRSVRLALLLYARSNGFDLQDKDLDVVHESLFNTQQPDLGPVLATALEVMERRYTGGERERVLAALQRG